MAITDMATKALADRLPKVIDPKTHAIIDYLMAGTFVAMGTFFWKGNKRAAMGALLCGTAVAATSLLTDYPGGVKKVISFATHGKIDAGLAGLTATMPNFLAFGDEDEAGFFRAAAIAESIVTGLTNFNAGGSNVVEMPSPRTA